MESQNLLPSVEMSKTGELSFEVSGQRLMEKYGVGYFTQVGCLQRAARGGVPGGYYWGISVTFREIHGCAVNRGMWYTGTGS